MSESKKTVFVVGLGPGGGQFLTVQAQSALQQAEVLCGYTVYIDLVRPLYPEKECYTTVIAKAFTCKTFGHITRTGYSHIFHITFQHRNAQSLEKASVCQ